MREETIVWAYYLKEVEEGVEEYQCTIINIQFELVCVYDSKLENLKNERKLKGKPK
jgi:hypothetical protein